MSHAAQASTIVLPIKASLADIQAKLNSLVPGTLYAVDENRNACVPAKMAKVCLLPNIFTGGCSKWGKTYISPAIDCHLNGSVTRGAISIAGTGDTLNLSMPVSVSITAKGRGVLGSQISTTATGDATVTAAVKADIDENWNPTALVNANYRWDKLIGVNILGFRITFADKVDPEIKKALTDLQAKLPGMLKDFDLKDKVAKGWDQGFTTLQVSPSPEVWLRFSPKTVGYDGFKVVDGFIQTSLMAGGDVETFIGSKPSDPAKVPLPQLVKKLPAAGFEFNLPISLDYHTIETEAKKALKVGEVQTIAVPNLGKVDVTFNDIKIYQTEGDLLAIGLTMDAKPPASLLDTKGTIWLTGSVKVDNAAKRVSVEKLGVFGKTDNAAFDLLVSLVSIGPVNEAIRKAVSRDYSSDYQKAIMEANKALRRQISDDLYFVGKLDEVDANSVAAGPSSILINLKARGSGEAGLGELPQ